MGRWSSPCKHIAQGAKHFNCFWRHNLVILPKRLSITCNPVQKTQHQRMKGNPLFPIPALPLCLRSPLNDHKIRLALNCTLFSHRYSFPDTHIHTHTHTHTKRKSKPTKALWGKKDLRTSSSPSGIETKLPAFPAGAHPTSSLGPTKDDRQRPPVPKVPSGR